MVKILMGYMLKCEGEIMEFVEFSCVMVLSFWKWCEFVWLELDELEKIEEFEWKELVVFVVSCGLFGVFGFVVDKFGVGLEWLSCVLYGVVLVVGGWDVVRDMWENLKEWKVDIYFFMFVVVVGVMCIGVWGEVVLLLFLFLVFGVMEDYVFDCM